LRVCVGLCEFTLAQVLHLCLRSFVTGLLQSFSLLCWLRESRLVLLFCVRAAPCEKLTFAWKRRGVQPRTRTCRVQSAFAFAFAFTFAFTFVEAESRWRRAAVVRRRCARLPSTFASARAETRSAFALCARPFFVRSFVRSAFVRDFTVLESPFSGALLALSRDAARFPRALRSCDLQDYSFCLGRIRKRPVSDQWDFKSAQFAPLRSFATADSLASAPFRDSRERKCGQITAKRGSFAAICALSRFLEHSGDSLARSRESDDRSTRVHSNSL